MLVIQSIIHLQTQVGFISHKAGSGPRDFQQYGGISKDKQLANNPKVQDFAKAVQKARPDGLKSGDKILSVNNEIVEDWVSFSNWMDTNDDDIIELIVERNNLNYNLSIFFS